MTEDQLELLRDEIERASDRSCRLFGIELFALIHVESNAIAQR